MDKRLKKLLIKSIIALIGIISFIFLICYLFLSVTKYAMAIVCIIIPVACIIVFRIIIHTVIYSYLYATYDGSATRDANEIKVYSWISKIDLISKVITGLSVSVILLLAIIGRSASPAVKDINTADFIDVAVESVDIKSEKYFSNCITNYYSYGEKCNDYTTTLFVDRIINCPRWFIKYHYNKSYSMLDKRGMLGEELTATDVNNDRYSCAYVLRDNGTRISLVAMNDNSFISLTVSSSESDILVDTEKVLNYVDNYFSD